MKSQYKNWTVQSGKGSRVYIHLDKNDCDTFIHPEEIRSMNGLGTYDFDEFKDLATAILMYEKLLLKDNSVMDKLEQVEGMLKYEDDPNDQF